MIEAIKQARKTKNITQNEAADYLGVSRKRYSELERGKITLEQAIKLLNWLDKAVIIVEMYQISTQNTRIAPIKHGILNKASKLPIKSVQLTSEPTTDPHDIDTSELNESEAF